MNAALYCHSTNSVHYYFSSGTFWQVTDFHYDANYSTSGSTKANCHITKGEEGHLGDYGNYLCDSPYKLVESVVKFMSDTEAKPDFILWTGYDSLDFKFNFHFYLYFSMFVKFFNVQKYTKKFICRDNIAHVPERELNSHKVFQLVANVSSLLMAKFAHIAIYPAIGKLYLKRSCSF